MVEDDSSASACLSRFTYDGETGLFWRRHAVKSDYPTSEPAGERHGCYVRLTVWLGNGERLRPLAHRVAWLFATGSWPNSIIDHINGNGRDNRFNNLRVVTHSQNSQNKYRARADNNSGLLGVRCTRHPGRWMARINIGGKLKYLGTFGSPEEAHAVYMAAKAAHHIRQILT